MHGHSESADQRARVAEGLELRILRREPISSDSARAEDGSRSSAPFLLVHGLASNARLWDGVARRLTEAGHRSVAVDLRGHGR
ncbi:MAG TPA: alpha/beta fold hydrolase, partial [Candidatus Limnocylindrales bacterium]